MNRCPVCEKYNQALLCDGCGFDASRHYERFPTLAATVTEVRSVAVYRAERKQREKKMLRCPQCGDQGFALNLADKIITCLKCQKVMTEEEVRRQHSEYVMQSAEEAGGQDMLQPEQYPNKNNAAEGHELYLQGLRWYHGTAHPKDDKKAVECFQQSADLENPHGQFWLAYCYYCGLGVTKNYGKAFKYFQKSATQGYAPAQYWLGECFYYGNGVRRDLGQARLCYQQAADQQLAAAQYAMGMCYYYGIAVQQDYEKAVAWFDSAAKQGDPSGQYWLGRCLYHGYGVQQDYETAAMFFQKAAEQGYAKARIGLGECYQYGRGVEKDIVRAADQYRLAQNSNIPGGETAYRALLENASRADLKLLRRFGHISY